MLTASHGYAIIDLLSQIDYCPKKQPAAFAFMPNVTFKSVLGCGVGRWLWLQFKMATYFHSTSSSWSGYGIVIELMLI